MGVAAMMMLSIIPAMADSTLPQTDEHNEALCDAMKRAVANVPMGPARDALIDLLQTACN